MRAFHEEEEKGDRPRYQIYDLGIHARVGQGGLGEAAATPSMFVNFLLSSHII
jgi:hypothetical protein